MVTSNAHSDPPSGESKRRFDNSRQELTKFKCLKQLYLQAFINNFQSNPVVVAALCTRLVRTRPS
jgi:hypothetical protein